jgi:hypothetical protein
MTRGEPYVVCDLDGQPVTPEQAKHLIAEHFTVPPRSAGGAQPPGRGRPLTRRSRRKSSHSAKLDTRRPSPPAAWTKDSPSSTSVKRPSDTPASLGNQPRRRSRSQQGSVAHRLVRMRRDQRTKDNVARRTAQGLSTRRSCAASNASSPAKSTRQSCLTLPLRLYPAQLDLNMGVVVDHGDVPRALSSASIHRCGN